MGSINRYIFRTTISAFLVVLVSLTAVIWVTQALHDFDLVTSQGQTILVFMGITGLIIPLLVLVIAPIALLIAVAHILHKMSTDSEIIVLNASGMSPWVLFRAFMLVGVVVSLFVMVISAYFAPKGLRLAIAHYNGATLWFPNASAAPQKLEWKGSHLGITVSPDGRFLITAMQEPTMHGWRLLDGKHMRAGQAPVAELDQRTATQTDQQQAFSAIDVSQSAASQDESGNDQKAYACQ